MDWNRNTATSRLSGAAVIVTSCAFLYVASGYPAGSIANIGPGFFPMVLASITLLLGIYLTIAGDDEGTVEIEKGTIYQIALVSAAIVAFYFLLDRLGLAISVFISSMIYLLYFKNMKIYYKFLVAVGTAVFCHVVFIEMINLQVRHFP